MRRHAVLLAVLPLACGCGSGTDGPTARFDVPTDVGTSPTIDAVPFPNDIYLDDSGALDISPEALPFGPDADADARANLAAGFAAQGCFGVTGGVTFPIANLADGEGIDADSATAAARLFEVGGDAVPATATVRREGTIVVEPRRGTVLRGGTTYVAALGPGLITTEGTEVSPSSSFKRVRSGDPRGVWEERAATALGPALKGDEIAAASFTTCDFATDLESITAQLDAAAPSAAHLDRLLSGADLDDLLGIPDDNAAPGLDNPGGPAHADIGFVAIGHFDAASYLAATPSTQGFFEKGENGEPMVKGMVPIPFVLVLPKLTGAATDLPVVIYQHGINGATRDVFGVANGLAARGLAVIAIDMPFHGGRFPNARDNVHNFTGADGGDGLADSAGSSAALFFFDIQTQPQVTWLDPRVMTDGFRQAVVDVMSLARLLDSGDWSEIAGAAPELAGLSFAGKKIAYASESFGGFVGVPALAFEERLKGGFLSVAGGGLTTQLLESSAVYGPLFSPILQGAFAVGPNEVLPSDAPPHTHYLYQLMTQVMDRADPLTYAARAGGRDIPLVLGMAHEDESVPNPSGEALAAALGLSWQPEAGELDGPEWVVPEMIPTAAPGAVTDIVFERDPATHGMLTRADGLRRFKKVDGYFEALDPPLPVDNPIADMQQALGDFAAAVTAP